MPFLPLYISELGVADVGEIAMWTGLTLGATPAVTAISAPLWGRVGDRYGSKLLVLRSLAAFVLTKAAMAFVTAPWQLFALRALLGVFAGYGALTMAMAAESVPRERMARAIGIGADGAAARPGDRAGDRRAARAARRPAPRVPRHRGVLPRGAGADGGVLQRAARTARPRGRRGACGSVVRELAGTPGFLLSLAVIFGLQTVDRSFGPILPLYVEQLGVSPDRIATVSGVLFSLAAFCAALGHKAGALHGPLVARALIHRGGDHRRGTGADRPRPVVWTLATAIVAASIGIGVAMTAAYARPGRCCLPTRT